MAPLTECYTDKMVGILSCYDKDDFTLGQPRFAGEGCG